MRLIRSLGQKLTGKRINNIVSKVGTVDNKLPMRRQTALVDDERVSIITIGDGREPLLGVEVPDKFIDTDHLKGVFDDDEAFDVYMDNGRLVLTKDRNRYRFPLGDVVDKEPRLPQIDEFDTSFILDPRKLPKKYGKDCKGGYIKISAGYDHAGRKVARAFVYTDDNVLRDCVELSDSWNGTESVSRYPIDRMKNIGKLGDRIEVSLSSDYPMFADVREGEVKATYALAPLIVTDGVPSDEEAQEREWLSSHNRRIVGRRIR